MSRTVSDFTRLRELCDRLVAPGPKASQVSASETHEIADGVTEVLRLLAIYEDKYVTQLSLDSMIAECKRLQGVIEYAGTACHDLIGIAREDVERCGQAGAHESVTKARVAEDILKMLGEPNSSAQAQRLIAERNAALALVRDVTEQLAIREQQRAAAVELFNAAMVERNVYKADVDSMHADTAETDRQAEAVRQ